MVNDEILPMSLLEESPPKKRLVSDMDVSKNSGTPKSSIWIGFSIINHPFWGTPIFGNTHMFVLDLSMKKDSLFGPWPGFIWLQLPAMAPMAQLPVMDFLVNGFSTNSSLPKLGSGKPYVFWSPK